MGRLVDLIVALVRADWGPIAVINVIGTVGVVLLVLNLPLDPDPTLRNFAPLGVLIGFLLICMTYVRVTDNERER